MPGVLGVVVLYNPDEGVLNHVGMYIDEIDHLLVVDNSVPPSALGEKVVALYKKATLISNNDNKGIASVLNQAASYGVSNGFRWLLTMDQDSSFEPGAMLQMKQFVMADKGSLGILSPYHRTPQAPMPDVMPSTKKLRITMTSGNLLSLDAFSRCGPFEEKLFIDSVDHEYCLRLRKNGYEIVRLNASVLNHQLGQIVYHRFLGIKFKTTNHSADRKYYITRNRLYVMGRYFFFDFRFFVREFREMLKSFWTVIFFETDKWPKIRAMLRGAWHFLTGKYGRI